ncbi:hypothetical protein [Pseudomarimonas arenosa]|uniref:Sel1 repeat family protein n=1 Tax=Pseudomarimonas arenosa TaxID=2774145 RepID=A0AAW3ZMP1_9GAMM|nr:hypothetical protein [Pseudomarimonas arenosa]MBD8526180.1 hypothetical protein [Pseudomarimonas arenosa]
MIFRPLVWLSLAVGSGTAIGCESGANLQGTLSIPFCDATEHADCVPAGQVIHDYFNVLDLPGVFSIGAQSSPWRIYDGDDRILTVEELAASVRAGRKDDTSVYLAGSWSAALPGGEGYTLAQRLSRSLDGFPVSGSDGFLWLTARGEMRTTRQAVSIWKSGPYSVRKGEDVMLAMNAGAMAQFEDRFADDGFSAGVLRAGVGHDVLGLCPERALAAFERAAAMGNAIGAYNAALMHEQAGDKEKAAQAFQRAALLGEAKAHARLDQIRDTHAPEENPAE